MKKIMTPIVRGGLIGVAILVVTNVLVIAYRAMGYELDFTREDMLVLSMLVVLVLRDWIYPRDGQEED